MRVYLMAATVRKKVRVVAVQDFDPSQPNDSIFTQELVKDAPEAQVQLSFHKGQCFEVLTKNIKGWWLYVRCVSSDQEEGFIPSICVVPLKEDLDDEK